MDHNTAVEKLVESLSFEVEAVPQDNVLQYKSTSHITPVNVKVRVRKKDKSGIQKGTICIPKVARTEHHPERIRLASSDQTIMSFNVLMEDSDNNMKSKKKNLFGSCLAGTADDDDDGPYMPIDDASGSKLSHKQKLTLSKTAGNEFAPGDVGRKPKKFFGPCKPGGCLDPPFGEDRYVYRPPDMKPPECLPTDIKVDSVDSHSSSKIKIDKETKSPSTDDQNNPDKAKPERCPNNDETQKCPPFDYKVDPVAIPLQYNRVEGPGTLKQSETSNNQRKPLLYDNLVEGPDTFKENETNINQRKRKGTRSDSASTVKISKRASGISNSVQSLIKGKRTKPPLEDKESNSLITYAGDEIDDLDNERLNKNKKSSVSSNRTSFDLNAPYYSPPKREIHKSVIKTTENIQTSFKPSSKAQDENLPDDRDGSQKKQLRMGKELRSEDTVNIEENDQSDNLTKTKYLKIPSIQKSQTKIIEDEATVNISLEQRGHEVNGSSIVLLDTDDYDNIISKTYDKDQVNNIPKSLDGAIEKYKTDGTFTVSYENIKDNDKQSKNYSFSKQSNSFISGVERGNEDTFNNQPEIAIEDLKNNFKSGIADQYINFQNDVDVEQTDASKEITKPKFQSDIDKKLFGYDTSFQDNTNTLKATTEKNLKSELIANTIDSKALDADTEDKRYSFEMLDDKYIVTLKPGTFYREISDVESDFKVTDSRSSIINTKDDTKDNTSTVQTATDKDLSSLIKTPIAKIDINSQDKLQDIDYTVSNVNRMSSKYLDGDRVELGSVNLQTGNTGTQMANKMSTITDMGTSKDTEITKYDEFSLKTDKDSKKFVRDITLDLAFKHYFDGRERVLKTLKTPLDSKIQTDPNVSVIQKQISLDGERTRVLIDPDTDMTIQFNSRFVENNQDNNNIHKGILITKEHATYNHHHQNIHQHVTFSSKNLHENLSYLYEKELVPLQNMIKDLKAEIDALAGQHKRRARAAQLNRRLKPVKQCRSIVIKE